MRAISDCSASPISTRTFWIWRPPTPRTHRRPPTSRTSCTTRARPWEWRISFRPAGTSSSGECMTTTSFMMSGLSEYWAWESLTCTTVHCICEISYPVILLIRSYWGSAAGRKPADKNAKLCQLVSPSTLDQRKCEEIVGTTTTTETTSSSQSTTPTATDVPPTTTAMGNGVGRPSAQILMSSLFLASTLSVVCQ